MKIKKLHLKDFRLFRELEVEFTNDHLTVLIGGNGSGKSAVLDALASWLSRYIWHNTVGEYNESFHWGLVRGDIKRGTNLASINAELEVTDKGRNKPAQNFEVEIKRVSFEIDDLLKPGQSYQGCPSSIFNEDSNSSLPIIVYYRTNRVSTDFNQKELSEALVLRQPFSTYNAALDKAISSFEEFSTWFIINENIENQKKIEEENFSFRLPTLDAVRQAVERLVANFPKSQFGKLRVERLNSEIEFEFRNSDIANSIVTIGKAEDFIPLSNLSSGEKSILLLVADIARRLCIANPQGDPLQGNGIVLIDEIELHLHPAWQRTILGSLREIFPNVQFIVTTHSPQVLSSVHDENVLVIDDGKVFSAADPFGRDTNSILDEIMGTPERPAQAEELLKETFALLANGHADLEGAEKNIKLLKEFVTEEDPVFTRLANIIKRKKMIAAS
jgi:predicted ATP-binding protein involved in virulence